MSATVSFQMEEQHRERLDQIASELGRDRNWVINKAIDDYLEQYEWERAKIKRGVADFAAGRSSSAEEFKVKLEKKMRSTTVKRSKTKAE